ncbi:hypothetical protein OSTOST_03750 [Ostertagia ostertagi]
MVACRYRIYTTFNNKEHEPCHGVGSVNTIRTWYYKYAIWGTSNKLEHEPCHRVGSVRKRKRLLADTGSTLLSTTRSMSPAMGSAVSTQSGHGTTNMRSGALQTSWNMSPATESAASTQFEAERNKYSH